MGDLVKLSRRRRLGVGPDHLLPAESPSNRRDSGADSAATAPAERFGLDRLSVAFVTDEPDITELRERGFTLHESGTPADPQRTFGLSVAAGKDNPYGGSVFVGATRIPEKGWVGKVECNPARLYDPDGCSLLPVAEAKAAVARMFDVVERVGLVPMTDPGEGRVKRVDVARDFREVGIPSFYVRGLQNLRRPHARASYTYNNAQRNSAETLWVGSKTGGVRLYDQHEAYADKGAPRGSLRWEAEARGGWLERHGIRAVADLHAGAVQELADYRWEWSRMGTEVTGTANVVDAVERLICRHPRGLHGKRECEDWCDGLTRAKADRLLGQMVREALGVAAPSATNTASEYNRWKDRLGIVPSAELFSSAAEVPVTGRLDWTTGLEVAA